MAAQGTDRELYKEMTNHMVGLRERLGIPVYSFARRVSRHKGRDLQRPRSCQ